VEDVTTLSKQLIDTSLPLFIRYRAMFALRNIGTEEAVLALAQGFNDTSALFRHEIGRFIGRKHTHLLVIYFTMIIIY
jgi:deoxyhypusine monooxygenase